LSAVLTACTVNGERPVAASDMRAAVSPQDVFFTALLDLCGQSIHGAVTSQDPRDEDWRRSDLKVGPIRCEADRIHMPLAVGENSSRTWIVTKDAQSLTLKHDHRHDDGTPDRVTDYGGRTKTPGTTVRQEFPVDRFSVEMFRREDLAASVTNIWALEIKPGEKLVYELSRAHRFFKAEFPLTATKP